MCACVSRVRIHECVRVIQQVAKRLYGCVGAFDAVQARNLATCLMLSVQQGAPHAQTELTSTHPKCILTCMASRSCICTRPMSSVAPPTPDMPAGMGDTPRGLAPATGRDASLPRGTDMGEIVPGCGCMPPLEGRLSVRGHEGLRAPGEGGTLWMPASSWRTRARECFRSDTHTSRHGGASACSRTSPSCARNGPHSDPPPELPWLS